MRQATKLMRPALLCAAMLGISASPVAAQIPANTNTTSTAGVITQDSVRREAPDDDKDFPWGLLGLLGLAGLLGRRKVETVETIRTVPPTTGRPGDPSTRL